MMYPRSVTLGFVLFVGVCTLSALFLLFSFFGTTGLVAGLLLLAMGVVSYHLELGLYLMLLLAPMIGLQIDLGVFERLLIDTSPYTATIQIPLVDIVAFVLLGAFVFFLIRQILEKKGTEVRLPGFPLYSLFLLSAVLSLTHVYGSDLSDSIKYLIRFPLFVYLTYVVVGVNIMRREDIMHRALVVYASVGVFAAVLGLLGAVLGLSSVGGVHRAVPMALGWFDPFNYGSVQYGHILLAEVLTTTLPVLVYLAYTAKERVLQQWYTSLSVGTAIVCLLTFSRAGWLTLIVQVLVLGWLFFDRVDWKRWTPVFLMGAVACVPIALAMYTFLGSGFTASSNSTRLVLMDIGWRWFLEYPWFGQGIGTFVPHLKDVWIFTYEFGDPIDAHGILTKISAEQGLFGVVSFGLFVWWMLSRVYARLKGQSYSRDARAGFFLSLFLIITPLFFQLFNTQYYSARMWVPFGIALAVTILYYRQYKGMSFLIGMKGVHRTQVDI